jgi:hypothetical protein
MPDRFRPRLEILPAPQKRLWPELAATGGHFTLYGGTAIALRLGHRPSVDFDFFSPASFEPRTLLRELPYLQGAIIAQAAPNTLTVTVDRGGPVQLSFFGGIDLGQVAASDVAEDTGLKAASLVDLAGVKVALVTQRAEVRDYLDIHALLTKAKISLPTMLAAGSIIYGAEFSPLQSLKAISYHDDLPGPALTADARRELIAAVRATDPTKLPVLNAVKRRGKTS